MSRIDLNIVATGNFTQVETQLARLRTQAAALSSTISGMSVFGPRATADMQTSVRLFEDSLRSTGLFQTQMVNLRSETEKFGQSLQRGNLRLGDSFRVATGHIRNQQTAISKLAREQVRLMNSTTVAMGDGRQMVITPRGIDEAINKQQILNQEYRIFRQVVSNGSTQLINWGKNTQWAGRQLTVGLTVPLTIFGATASKMFMDADKQLTRLAKVYGDASKGMVDATELDSIRTETLGLAKEIASTMGVAVDQTIGIAADLAATGKEGNELLEATSEAMRLSVLGEVDRQDAMRATLSIQSVFNQDTKELAETINFLNAVENQTSTSLNDLVEGIVKAGPVVQGLGGDVEDLALMMVAMREGGIPAAEAANAIKSSLASLINPTKETRKLLNGFGIDLIEIVDKNAGNVTGTLVDLQGELANLDDISRQRAIEQIFGKFQFSRINALMSNLGKVGSQTEEVMKISGMSVQQLAETAEKELTTLTESASMKFTRALEGLKANLIPIGEVFTSVGTLLLNVANKVLEIFNSLPDPIKNFINGLMLITAVVGPIVMITGVLGNFFGYLIKGISSMMALKRAGRGVFEHFTPESIAARQASELVEKAVYDEAEAINILSAAIDKLNETLARMGGAANVAGSAMRDMAQDTLAGAESAAIVSGGMPQIFRSERDRYSYKGHEISHLTPASALQKEYGFSEKSLRYLLSPTTLLGSQDIAEAKFQQALGSDFAKSGYYDPSTMGTREQALMSMARDKSERTLVGMMSEEGMGRLYPTMEEHTALVAKYQVGMEQLFKKNSGEVKRIMQEIDEAILNDDMPRAAEILRQSIDGGDEKIEDLIAQRAMEYRQEFDRIVSEQIASGIDPTEARAIASREVQVSAARREEEILSAAPTGVGFRTTGKGGRAGSGAGVFALAGELPISEELTNAAQMRIDALKLSADADKRIAATSDKLLKVTQDELNQKNKAIANMKVRAAYSEKSGAVERNYALIGDKWYQVTKDKVRLLDASNKKDAEQIRKLQERNRAESDKARSSRMAARADMEEAQQSKNSANADREEANASRNAARADMAEASGNGGGFMGRMRGRMGGMGGMGALSALGMVTSMIPVGEPDSGASQAADVVGGIAMGAGTGAMIGSIFPGIGTAIGAAAGGIIGGLAPGLSILSSNAEKAALELEAMRISTAASRGTLLDLEQNLLGIEIKTLDEVPLEAFGEKTEEAKSQLQMFTDALVAATEAEEASLEKSRIEQISGMTNAEELISSSMFQSMIFQAISGGASKENIKLMLEGYLDVADKEYFSSKVMKYLDETIPDDGSASKIASDYINGLIATNQKILGEAAGGAPRRGSALGRVIQETREWETTRAGRGVSFDGMENASLFDIVSRLQENPFIMGQFQSGELQSMLSGYFSGQITEDQILAGPGGGAIGTLQAMGLSIGGAEASVPEMMQILSALADITALEPDVSTLADSVNEFEDNIQLSADSITTLLANGDDLKLFEERLSGIDLDNLDPSAITEIAAQLNNMGDQGPEVSNFFMDLINSGVDMEIALKAVRLLMNGTITDIDRLKTLAKDEIRFNIVYQEQYNPAIRGGVYNTTGISEMPMPGVSDLVSSITSGGGSGGGGSVDTSAIEEEFDKRIEQQDRIIEKIREEREERQKLLNLQEESLNFSIKEQSLKNQISRAKAEGNLAEAALLQAQLDGERKKKRQEEAERRRQEQEDKRIEEAEKAKKEIEEQKSAAVDAAKGGSGGGGGGLSQEEISRIEQRVTYLQGVLAKSLQDFGKGIEEDILRTGLSGFFESGPVVEFKKRMEELGVPVQVVTDYLDQVFDNFIMQTELVSTEQFKEIEDGLKDIGYEGDLLSDILPNAFAIIQDDNLTDTEKIDQISEAFKDNGMDADEAKEKARLFFAAVGDQTIPTTAIEKIASAWRRAGDSAARSAALSALAADVAAGVVSPDALEGRLASIDLRYPMASGGYVSGPGGPTSDLIPAMLSNGEYVIRASSVDKYGIPFLEAVNKGMLPTAAMGGMISKYPSAVRRMGGGGYIMNRYANGGEVNSKLAEYNISVNVAGTNASAEEIANTVMNTIKRKERMSGSVTRI